MPTATKEMLNAADAAKRLGILPSLLKDWRNKGLGPAFVRLSHKTVVYDSEVLEEFIRVRTCQPTVQAITRERHGSL